MGRSSYFRNSFVWFILKAASVMSRTALDRTTARRDAKGVRVPGTVLTTAIDFVISSIVVL